MRSRQWLNKPIICVIRNRKIAHRIHPNFQSARSKFYDECLASDLGVAESSQVKFAAVAQPLEKPQKACSV
jgi:hypothetical protein